MDAQTAWSNDFSKDKPNVSEPIPDGTVLYVQHTYTPGGAGPGGALTKSKPSAENPTPDTEYLKSEFTVLRGPYRGRKFWSNMTTTGGKVDEKGNSIAAGITRGNIRLMLDSANGLSSKDENPEAAAKRVLPNGFASLQGLKFVCKAKIEPARGGYAARNGLGQVLTTDMKDYPKTEAELDTPVVRGLQAPAVPAPVWAPVAAIAAAPAPAAMVLGAQTPANNLPAWAQ